MIFRYYQCYNYNQFIKLQIMNIKEYLRTGDLITISHENQFLAIESLTQSVPTMKESISNSINSIFLLTTQKCYEKSLQEQKPLASYNEDDIYYSEPILLYHLLSGKLLSYNKDIENKASIELIGSLKQNCKFSIKSIFKCQTIITRKIKNKQSVIITPAEAFNHEGNIALVAIRNDNRKGDQSYVLMKKNQSSKFELIRKNDPMVPQSKISNLFIYQLLNIETKKNLYMTVNEAKHKDIITFEKSINQFGSYFDFRIKNFQFDTIGVSQRELKYGMPFYIHSWKQNKYLSINIIGDACLTQIPNQQAEFVVQSYSGLELDKDSVVRIKHLSTHKYLALNTQNSDIQMVSQIRLIDTYQIVKVPLQDLRLNVFINDAHQIIQRQLAGKKITYSNKDNLFKVLRELNNFIYGDQLSMAQFLSMKAKISCKLSSNDQRLLANIGIINTLVRMCRIFIQQITKQTQSKEFQQKDKSQQQAIIISTMMSIVGICNRNAASTRILVQQMPLLYESLVSVGGIIQSFYNLFKDSKELLLILQNTSHKIGRKQVSSMQLLINRLSDHELDINTKCKLIKLLEVFIIVNHKQKILGHEAILLKSLVQEKLSKVLLPIRSNDHQDMLIFIPQKKSYQQLEQLLNSRRVYEKQLQLVKTQLQLLCSLCLNSSSQSFAYVNKIISQEMLYRYLKGNLQPEFKQVFMKLLIDVYLSNLASRNYSQPKSFVISRQGDQKQKRQFSKIESSVRDNLLENQEQLSQIVKGGPSHSKVIQDIQNYILQVTKKSIVNQIIDSSFYMNLKSLRKFLQLRILDKDEVVQFRLLLIQYIAKFSKASFKQEQKKKIVLQIIKIMTDYLNQYIQSISEEFIYMLRSEEIENKNLYSRFLLFSNQYIFFNTQLQSEQLKFLPQLIKQSIEFNSIEIFVAASTLLKLVNERCSIFFKSFRQKIIIDSEWSYSLFDKINKNKRSLNKQIHNYMRQKGDGKKVLFIEQLLNQIVKQLNYFFFQNSNSSSNQFCQLTQNMYRQMNLLETIINFLNQSQERFKQPGKANVDVYSTCFQFIGMYLQDNRKNFFRFQEKYLDIKFVFQHPDRGQIKLLNNLIKLPYARDLMIDQIIDCILMSFANNADPNPYTLLALINSISTPYLDKERIEILAQKMIRQPQILQSILKVSESRNSYSFSWSSDQNKKNYHRDWILYSYLLIKFLVILIEQSSERTSLSYQIQKYININSLIQLLKIGDLLTNTSMVNLQGSILKNQVIKLFTKIYIPLLEKQNQIEVITTYVYENLQHFNQIRQEYAGAVNQLIDEVMQKTSDHGSIIYESEIGLKTNNNMSYKNFEKYFNPIYTSIVQYYPFMIKILDCLVKSNQKVQSSSDKKVEIALAIDSGYSKLKQFIQHKFTPKMFSLYSKQYQIAISNLEEIFKKRLGFVMRAEENQEDEEVGEVQTNNCFINSKIENTIKCYKFASNKIQKKIYQAFLTIFHSQDFRQFLRKDQQSLPITLNMEQFQKVISMTLRFLSYDYQKFTKCVHLFYYFCKFNKKLCLKMNFLGARQMIMDILSNEKDDGGNKKLGAYLAITSKLFMIEVQKQTQVQKKTEGYIAFDQNFINRIKKKIESEKLLYSNSKMQEQANVYSQNGLLTYESIEEQFNIQLCLSWIRNMAIVTPFLYKQNLYYTLFMETVDLFKTYSVFIKQFNCKYVNFQIYNKMNLCLEIIFHFITGLTSKSIFINYLIERQIWNDLNLILGLDDGWGRNLDELEDTLPKTFSKIIRNQLRMSSQIFLKQAQKYYINSKKLFKQLIPQKYFPLIPKKALYSELKSNIIMIIKQFKNFPMQIKKQLLSRIQMPIINKNIFQIYKKHNKLFSEYGIPSTQIDINFSANDEWRDIADNISIQNGVDLTSIKMYIGTISGNSQIKAEYDNIRLQAMTSKKIQSAFTSIFNFFRDFFLLFISCFLNLCRKKKDTEKKDQQLIDDKKMQGILNFFLLKLGRVQLRYNSELLVNDFMIRPQCNVNKDIKQKFIESINFISMQLKLQSINNQGGKFLLYFQNQIDFCRMFNKFSFLIFLTKNFEMITYLNFAVIVAQNIVLIANSNSKDEYFVTNSLDQPFVWLQIISTIIAGLTMVAYCVKDLHLLIKNINFALKIRSQSYGSNYNNYSPFTKFCIKLSKIFMDATFDYHLIYTTIVCLVFYNKLFVALLMLDIFLKIPTLKNLLMSVWRPKIQLILALVSFVLVQYFFSIFMYFNFKKQTLGYCSTLGSCFGFVFVTTYKAVGGFVGYLFIKNGSVIQPVNFFEIFQDMYVVLIFQIFFALILAIIIDTFSVIRNQQTVRKDYLNGCCIVCNLDKTRFNSSTMSFKAHIAVTHNIWNYFYFYEYIFHKPATKRTSYQRQIYLSRTAHWLPIDTSYDVSDQRMVRQQKQAAIEQKKIN